MIKENNQKNKKAIKKNNQKQNITKLKWTYFPRGLTLASMERRYLQLLMLSGTSITPGNKNERGII